jgi:acyl-coenzyme A thioesterase PaaI-like protein
MSTADEITHGAQVSHPHAARVATDATRELIAALRLADAPPADLEQAAALVREAAALLVPHRVDSAVIMQSALRPEAWDHGAPSGDDPATFFPYSPVVGPLNAIAPPLSLEFDGERMHGTAELDAPYVGPPGMVHGGIIALIFDELLGATNVCHGQGAFTGTLNVRYERPTPLRAPLVLEGWLDRVEGRKVITSGTISHAGEVTARAEGIFIRAEVADLPF